VGVERDIEGKIQTRLGAWPVVAAVTGFADARKIMECPLLQIDPSDAIGS